MSMETLPFKTEMTKMMDIIVNSLYSNREIFLRELISNASDAIDKIRFDSITDPDLLEGESGWKIKLIVDKDAGTLTVRDNGIGMDRDAVVENLGTVARSGTREFLEKLQQTKAEDRPELIGQFGLGFYASFMVADKVTVLSRMAGDKAKGVRWESSGEGEFQVETVEKERRGTDVVLHLKEDAKDFLDEWKLRTVVRNYSDFIEHPVVMDVMRTEKIEGAEGEEAREETRVTEETLNSRQAVWLRSKSELSEQDYNEFYKHISRDFGDPAKVIHYVAEGVVEFKALLYLPRQRPFDFLNPERKNGLNLYIRRVFIMDDCTDLLPSYLRFVQGVVDAADLPLNVSRELLQQNPLVDKIQSNLTAKILSTLKAMKDGEKDKYIEFYKNFGLVLKEGVHTDWTNKEKLADLLLFESAKTEAGDFVSLAEYVEAMPEDQKEIYFLLGESRKLLEASPYLEGVRKKGYDVLFMTEPIDEWVVQGLMEYKGKRLVGVDKGELEGLEGETEKEQKEKKTEEMKDLLGFLKEKIAEVEDVRLSSRLTDSASCLVSKEGRMGAYVENILKKIGSEGEFEESPRILELNPDHPVVAALRGRYEADPKDARLEDYGRLLYEQAVLAEGSKLKDPVGFARRMNDLLVRDLT